MAHDLTIANGVRGDRLSPGESTVVDAGVVAGDLDAWCSEIDQQPEPQARTFQVVQGLGLVRLV